MKRIISLLLAALLALSFLSCAAPKEGSDPAPTGAGASETEAVGNGFIVLDRQCTFSNMHSSPLLDIADTLYYSFGAKENKVYFSDKEHREWMPLCFKPDCFHRTSDCNAYIEGGQSLNIWAYGEHIYYMVNGGSTPQLWRMKLDGSDHEYVLALNFFKEEENVYSEYTWSAVFHNKYLFVWFRGVKSELFAAENGADTLIYLVDLSLEKPSMELTSFTYETSLPVCGQGDTVYTFNTLENNSIYKLDLAKGTSEKLCEIPFYPESGFVLKGSRLYAADSIVDHQLVYIDLDTGTLTNLRSLDENVKFVFTDDYILGAGSVSIDPSGPQATPKGEGTLIYDYEGNLIQHIPYETYNVNIFAFLASGNYVLGYDADSQTLNNLTSPPQWYLDLSELGSEDMTWHKWAPEDQQG